MKKHAQLYNRIFEALHADDKFVLVSKLTHEEIVELMAQEIHKYITAQGAFLIAPKESTLAWNDIAEVALLAIQATALDACSVDFSECY